MKCALVAFNQAELLAGQQLVEAGSVATGESLRDVVKAYVPSVRNLPWDAVFARRNDKRVGAFRRWLAASSRLNETKSARIQRAADDLWSAVKDLQTDTKAKILKGLAGNMPLPLPVNPFSIALSAKAVRDAHQFEKKYDWLLFLHSMHDATKSNFT